MRLIEKGREPPEAYFQQPEIPEDLQFYWLAFFDLSSERQIGMGIGPIPRSQIRHYAIEHDILSRDEFEHFYRIVRAIDEEYITIANAVGKKANEIPIDNVDATKFVIQQAGKAVKEMKTRKKLA